MKNYVVSEVGYVGLMFAIVQQARNDAENAKTETEKQDALNGINEWREVLFGGDNPLQAAWMQDALHGDKIR